MLRSQQAWIETYQQKGALFIHDGNPARPHPELTSGNHSNGFFNSRLVIADESLLNDAAYDLVELFVGHGHGLNSILGVGVVGPQTGGTKLAELMSRYCETYTDEICFSVSPAKDETNGVKSMIFSDEDKARLPGKRILLCDDVLTTAGSVELAATAVTNAGGIVLPYVAVLVNRSGLSEVNGKKILALINHPMPMWKPEECPLCKVGSKAVRPKDNWALLTAEY